MTEEEGCRPAQYAQPAESDPACGSRPSPPEIKIGHTGRITTGPFAGTYLFVKDNLVETGGYLILYGEDEQFEKGGDDWVPAEKLEDYFAECDRTIEWLIRK